MKGSKSQRIYCLIYRETMEERSEGPMMEFEDIFETELTYGE